MAGADCLSTGFGGAILGACATSVEIAPTTPSGTPYAAGPAPSSLTLGASLSIRMRVGTCDGCSRTGVVKMCGPGFTDGRGELAFSGAIVCTPRGIGVVTTPDRRPGTIASVRSNGNRTVSATSAT